LGISASVLLYFFPSLPLLKRSTRDRLSPCPLFLHPCSCPVTGCRRPRISHAIKRKLLSWFWELKPAAALALTGSHPWHLAARCIFPG